MMAQAGKHDSVILYFGNDWFAENRTSSHHIARWLARRHRVYYIECPGLRAPQKSGRDIKKIWAKLQRFFAGSRTVEEGLKVRTLLQLPFHRFGWVRRLNQLLLLASLRWLIWREGIRRPISWFMVPHGAVAYILVRHPARFPRAAVMTYAVFNLGASFYWLAPTAPPWYAVRQGHGAPGTTMREPVARASLPARRAQRPAATIF